MTSGDSRHEKDTLGALALVAALLIGFVILPRVLHRPEAPLVGHLAPDLSLALVANGAQLGGDGQAMSLSQLRGRPVLLDFWATWCGPCRMEAPIVDRASQRWRSRGVVMIGVNTDTPDQGDPRAFAQAHGLTYPIAKDPEGDASRAYAVDSLPTLVVISGSGKVVGVRMGVTSDAEIDRLISRAL